MSLLNSVSIDIEKIIWNYFHELNNYEKNLKKIVNLDYFDIFEFKTGGKYEINLIDFLEFFYKYKKTIEIKFKGDNKNYTFDFEYKTQIDIRFEKNNKNYKINTNNILSVIKKNEKIFNKNITEIIKLYHSDVIYILI